MPISSFHVVSSKFLYIKVIGLRRHEKYRDRERSPWDTGGRLERPEGLEGSGVVEVVKVVEVVEVVKIKK